MTAARSVSDVELHAYLDGEMSEGDSEGMREWLEEHPEAAQRMMQHRAIGEEMHRAYDTVLSEPVPERLQAVLADRRLQPRRWGPMRLAAAIAFLALGALAGFVAGRLPFGPGSSQPDFVANALGAHAVFVPEVRHPVEVTASDRDHLEKWLSKRLGARLVAPGLADQGFTLVGGRLLADGASPAAQLMYEDTGGRRLTLFIVKADVDGQTALRYAASGIYSALYWIDRPLGCAIVGNLPREQLQSIATRAYAALESD